jgi:hypothetical protein
LADWNEVGVRASNFYFKIFRKTEDYDEALEGFEGEIIEKMEEEEIDLEESWGDDLPANAISAILAGVVKQGKESNDEDLKGALHTHIINKLFESKDKHGEDQFSEWNKTLDEMM